LSTLSGSIMQLRTLEELSENSSRVHSLHPLTKIVVTVLFLALVVSFPRYEIGALAPFAFFLSVAMGLSQTPYRPLLKRLFLALPFSLFAGIANLFFDRQAAFFAGGTAVSFGFLSLVSILLKTALCVMGALLLMSTTPLSQISYELVRLKVPKILVMQLTLTYRYIAVLLEEASGMYHAYFLRAPGKSGIKMKDMGSFLGQILLRSVDRAQRVYDAMKCRGYHGDCRFGSSPRPGLRDVGILLLLCLVLFIFKFVPISNALGRLFLF